MKAFYFIQILFLHGLSVPVNSVSDSDMVGNVDTNKSTIGYVYTIVIKIVVVRRNLQGSVTRGWSVWQGVIANSEMTRTRKQDRCDIVAKRILFVKKTHKYNILFPKTWPLILSWKYAIPNKPLQLFFVNLIFFLFIFTSFNLQNLFTKISCFERTRTHGLYLFIGRPLQLLYFLAFSFPFFTIFLVFCRPLASWATFASFSVASFFLAFPSSSSSHVFSLSSSFCHHGSGFIGGQPPIHALEVVDKPVLLLLFTYLSTHSILYFYN